MSVALALQQAHRNSAAGKASGKKRSWSIEQSAEFEGVHGNWFSELPAYVRWRELRFAREVRPCDHIVNKLARILCTAFRYLHCQDGAAQAKDAPQDD